MQVCLRPPFIFAIPALLQLFPAIFAELATCNGESVNCRRIRLNIASVRCRIQQNYQLFKILERIKTKLFNNYTHFRSLAIASRFINALTQATLINQYGSNETIGHS